MSTAADILASAAAFAQARGLTITVAFGYTDPVTSQVTVVTKMSLTFQSPTGAVTPSWNNVQLPGGATSGGLQPLDIAGLSWTDPANFAAAGVPALTTGLLPAWAIRNITLRSAFNESMTVL
jgi:hypothetical protein